MSRRTLVAVAILLAVTGRSAAQAKISVKVENTPPPNELSAAVRAVLDGKAISVLDEKGAVICTVWPRKSLESKAAVEQVQKGLTYRELDDGGLVGAVKIAQTWADYRKQRIKPGVYTMRLNTQPMDGDHMGTAPFNEFCLLAPADKDSKPDRLEGKALHELSSTTTSRNHPSVMLLFPNPKPGDAPTIEEKPNETWVVSYKVPVTAGGQTAAFGFSLVMVGHSMAE